MTKRALDENVRWQNNDEKQESIICFWKEFPSFKQESMIHVSETLINTFSLDSHVISGNRRYKIFIWNFCSLL